MSDGYHIVITKDHSSGQRNYFISSFLYKALKSMLIVGVLLLVILVGAWGFITSKVIGYYELTKSNDSLSTIVASIDEIQYNYSTIIGDINNLQLLSTLPKGDILKKRMAEDTAQRVERQKNVSVGENIPSILPVIGVETQPFSNSGEPIHDGVDISASSGTVIVVTAAGIVSDISYDKYLGKVVTVDHGGGFSTRYGHCSEILVKKGKKVERGFAIALVGNSGKSSGPHVHYQVIKDSISVDPSFYY